MHASAVANRSHRHSVRSRHSVFSRQCRRFGRFRLSSLPWAALLVTSVGLVLGGGCSRSAGSGTASNDAADGMNRGGVAVVDLQEVARRLGRETEMEKSIAQATASLNEQLKQVRNQLQKQFDNQARELTDKAESEVAPASTGAAGPTAADQLAALKRQYDQQLTQYDAQAREKLAKHKASLIEQFRDQVRPVAQRIASQRGAGIVVTKNDSVVFATIPQADITEAVIAELQPKPVAEE